MHTPEFQPMMETGNPNWMQQAFLNIGKFLSFPPGNVRATYTPPSGVVSAVVKLQSVNRVGVANTGRWAFMFRLSDTSGTKHNMYLPSPLTKGELMFDNTTHRIYVALSDASGLVQFTPTQTTTYTPGHLIQAWNLGEITEIEL